MGVLFRDISRIGLWLIFCLEEKMSLIESWDEWNELIVESEMQWVEMSRMIGRCRVFSCNKDEFYEKKSQMGLELDEESPNIKFCRYMWNGTSIMKDKPLCLKRNNPFGK